MRLSRASVSSEMVSCITVPKCLRSNCRDFIRNVSDLLRLFRLRCGTADDHLVEQLPDQSKRIHLIIMLPSREAQQFRPEVGIPRRAFRHV